MGSGSSNGPAVGVELNPRVQHAGSLAARDGKDQLIDAPVLVRLEHGTVRYRYQDGGTTTVPPRSLTGRVDRPHEGTELGKKHGYFFHATLNDFSEEASYKTEEDWKFRYVCKGPSNAQQKKLFYVLGKGQQNEAGGIVRAASLRPQGIGYSWPGVSQQKGHVYFHLSFLPQSEELEPEEEDDLGVSETLENSVDIIPKDTALQVRCGDRVEQVKRRLSILLLKPPGHMHLYAAGEELSADQVISNLRTDSDGSWKHFRVLLRLK